MPSRRARIPGIWIVLIAVGSLLALIALRVSADKSGPATATPRVDPVSARAMLVPPEFRGLDLLPLFRTPILIEPASGPDAEERVTDKPAGESTPAVAKVSKPAHQQEPEAGEPQKVLRLPAPTSPARQDAAAAAPPPSVATTPEPAKLSLIVKNNIKRGMMNVWIDGKEVFRTPLENDASRMSRFYKQATLQAHETRESTIEITPGPHKIDARVYNASKNREYEESLEVDLEPGEQRSLNIVIGRTFGKRLSLSLD